MSVIIVSYRVRELLRDCLGSLLSELDGLPAEVWIVDNASDDGSADMVSREFPQFKLVRNATNRGFSAASNQVLRKAAGRYMLLLNPDTIIRDDAIVRLMEFLETHPQAGVVSPQLTDQHGRRTQSAAPFPSLRARFYELAGLHRFSPRRRGAHTDRVRVRWCRVARPVSHVFGACMLVRREAMQQVGLLDEQFFLYREDADWSKRFWSAGWSVWVEPRVEIVHVGGQSAAKATASGELEPWLRHACRNDVIYFRKHRGRPAAWLVYAMHLIFSFLGWAKWGALAGLGADPTSEHRAAHFRQRLSCAWRAREWHSRRLDDGRGGRLLAPGRTRP